MTADKRKPAKGRTPRDWRTAMTPEEATALKPIEQEMEGLRERLSWLSWQYHRIQNRATVRAGKSLTPPRRRPR